MSIRNCEGDSLESCPDYTLMPISRGHEAHRQVLRCSTCKVNSSSKETYVTNLLVLDPVNNSGTNYAVEVWDVKPHEVTPMSEVALTIIGVVNKTGGVPALRALIPPAEVQAAA